MKQSICTSLYIYSKRMQKSPLGTRPVIPDPLQRFFVDLLQITSRWWTAMESAGTWRGFAGLLHCLNFHVCALQASWIPKYQPFTFYIYMYTGWWYTYPSEKYSSVGMMKFPIYGKYHSCSKPPTSIYISPRYFLWLKPICLLHLSSKYREKSTIRSSWGSGCAPGHQPCSTTNCNALKVLRGSHLTELSIDMCIICQ